MILDVAEEFNMVVLNNGRSTFFRVSYVSRCVDTALASSSLVSSTHWFADIETHDSEHLPTYINAQKYAGTLLLRRAMVGVVADGKGNTDFVRAITTRSAASTRACRIPYP